MTFLLDPRLAADTFCLGDFACSRALLMNDSRYDWIILVPRRENLVELHDLTVFERETLFAEAAFVSEKLKKISGAKKINIAALGNIVAQLHVHVVARFESDPAWPGPVWGFGARTPYGDAASQEKISTLRAALGLA